MGHNDHIDFELHDAIQDLIDDGAIEEKSPAYGVAQQAIHSGYDSLTPKQKALYDAVIIKALKERDRELEAIHIKNRDLD